MKKTNIQKLRKSKGFTQIQLAEKAGISITSLRNFEQGGQPSNNVKRALAHALEVSLAEIGGLNVATWTCKSEESQAEKKFNEGIKIFFNDLISKADPLERIIIDDVDNMLGFQEILFLARKHGLEIPNIK